MRLPAWKVVIRAFVATLLLVTFTGSAQSQGTKMRVGYLPIAEDAPKFVGAEKGIFKKHGLDAELVRFESGPDQGTALFGGSIQVGTIGSPGLIFAAIAGRPVVAFFDNGSNKKGPAGHEYYAGIVVLDESTIKDLGDLKGKKLAVNVLKANSEIQTVLQMLRWNKENPGRAIDLSKDVQFVTLPFGSMPNALEKNIVDAASVIEPYFTQLKMTRKLRLIAPVEYALPNWPIGMGIATTSYAKQNGEALQRFRAAWSESVAWIQKNPDEAKQIVQKYTGVSPEVAKQISFPDWSDNITTLMPSVEVIQDGMLAAGMIQKKVNLGDYMMIDFAKLPK